MKYILVAAVVSLGALSGESRQGLQIDRDRGVEMVQTTQDHLCLSGSLNDPGRVVRLEWRNSRGAGGTLEPALRWTTPAIPLQPGENHLVITATDAAGYSEQSSRLIFRTTGDVSPQTDIAPASEAPAAKNSERAALVNPLSAQRWTNATIPYVLDASLPASSRNAFLAAVQHWQTNTPIRLVPRSTEANFLHVTRTDAAINTAGGVGMIGGEQIMHLVDKADIVTAIHEIGHTVGFAHEQSRTDRDRFIQLQFDNIRKEQFVQVDYVPSFLPFGVYDIQSIMQYFVTEITRSGDRIFRTVPDGLYTTNFAGLSPEDIDTVERMYNRPSGRTVISSNPPGLQVLVDGQPVTTPSPFQWTAGSTHTLEAPATQGSGAVRNQFARWSNDGARLQTIAASTSQTVFTAHYLQQCRMTLAPVDDPSTGSYTVSPFSPDDYYPCDANITLTASPAPGYTFLDWNTIGLGSRNPIVFRLTSARDSVKANFTNGQTVTFLTSPPEQNLLVNGGGVITPRTFATRPDAIFNVSAVDRVIGTERYRFAQWSQGGASSQQLVMGADSATYTASFNTDFYVSSAAVPSTDTGTVTQSPASPDNFYPSGSTVTFTATPAAGRDFRGWSGDLQGSSRTGSVAVTEQRYVAGNFRVLQAPTIAGLTPARTVAGAEPFTVFVSGASFVESVTGVTVNGKAHPTSVQGFNDLYFQLTADDLKAAGSLQIRVDNPGVTGVAAGASALVVAAPPADCSYVPSTGRQSAGASGGTLAVTLTTGAGCPWYPVSDSDWMETRGATAGSGSGVVQIWVKPNPSSQPRAGNIGVAGKTIAVAQDGTVCGYSLGPVADFSADGGDASLIVSVPVADCAWSAAADSDWLQFPNGSAGTGNAAVALHTDANPGPARQAVIQLGAASMVVVQAGSVFIRVNPWLMSFFGNLPNREAGVPNG